MKDKTTVQIIILKPSLRGKKEGAKKKRCYKVMEIEKIIIIYILSQREKRKREKGMGEV